MYRAAVAGVGDAHSVAAVFINVADDAADIAYVEYFVAVLTVGAHSLLCEIAVPVLARASRCDVAAVVHAAVYRAVPREEARDAADVVRARDGVFFVLGVRYGRVFRASDDAADVARRVVFRLLVGKRALSGCHVALVRHVLYRAVFRRSGDAARVRRVDFYRSYAARERCSVKIGLVGFSRVVAVCVFRPAVRRHVAIVRGVRHRAGLQAAGDAADVVLSRHVELVVYLEGVAAYRRATGRVADDAADVVTAADAAEVVRSPAEDAAGHISDDAAD